MTGPPRRPPRPYARCTGMARNRQDEFPLHGVSGRCLPDGDGNAPLPPSRGEARIAKPKGNGQVSCAAMARANWCSLRCR
jgi:hypothetical protein